MEIKTYDVLNKEGMISDNLSRQLYYESNGRNTFVLSLNIDTHTSELREAVTDAVSIALYKVTLEICDPKPIIKTRRLCRYEVVVLETIYSDPSISNAKIARNTGLSQTKIGNVVKNLVSLKYIEKADKKKRNSKWILLRRITDIDTKYVVRNGRMEFVFSADK